MKRRRRKINSQQLAKKAAAVIKSCENDKHLEIAWNYLSLSLHKIHSVRQAELLIHTIFEKELELTGSINGYSKKTNELTTK